MTVTEFITARLDEDEEVTQAAAVDGGAIPVSPGVWDYTRVLAQAEAMRQIVDVLKRHEQTLTWAEEQLRWSVPGTSFASALDNVGTARSTVQTLRPIAYALASIWRDHPDYNPA